MYSSACAQRRLARPPPHPEPHARSSSSSSAAMDASARDKGPLCAASELPQAEGGMMRGWELFPAGKGAAAAADSALLSWQTGPPTALGTRGTARQGTWGKGGGGRRGPEW
eukprot:scaffold575_cov313-Prasinococcus_capsulatus_cf.AAC.3